MGCRLLIPTELRSNHIKERASIHVLTLQPAGEYVGGGEVVTCSNISSVRDQVVVSPAAAVEAFAVPSHRRIKRFVDANQGKQRPVELRDVAAHARKISDVRSVPS